MLSKFLHVIASLFGCLPLVRRLSAPYALAFAFCVLATTSSVLAALWEERLFEVRHLTTQSGVVATVVPFSRNLSTLVDFLVLNPLVIFFLQQSRLQKRKAEKELGLTKPFSLYHHFGLSILSISLGVYAMKFYIAGSQFYDATMVPANNGHSIITGTGWIVYSWTAIYIAGVCYAAFEQGLHVSRIAALSEKDIPYEPFHPDGAGGVRSIMEPSLSFGYAMICLLLTFILFIIQDRIMYHIESNRLWGFAIYIALAVPLFGLPFYHLHRLMKRRNREYLLDFTTATGSFFSLRKSDGTIHDWQTVKSNLAAMEDVDKYHRTILSFPVWPVPISIAIPPLMSVAAAAFPLIKNFLMIAFPNVVLGF